MFALKKTLISLKGFLIITQQMKCNDGMHAVEKVSSYLKNGLFLLITRYTFIAYLEAAIPSTSYKYVIEYLD